MGERTPLPDKDHVYTYDQAAQTARALADYFARSGHQDETLERMANSMAAVLEARNNYETDTSRYGARVTFVDEDGEPHTALVMEPAVTMDGGSEAWDPHQEKMVDPREEYPLGTVQLIYTPEFDLSSEEGFFDRISNLEVATSVTPARGPDDTYCYYSDWEHALAE